MTDIVTIGEVTTSVISYKEQRVCTTQQLAELYGTVVHNLQENYRNNKSRFEEGKHFFKVVGGELRSFVDLQPSNFVSQISSKTRSLILWTERGAARHAKMLETDQAWDVFEQMEDSYFAMAKARAPIANGQDRSTAHDRLPLYHFVVDTAIKHRLVFSKAYILINLYAGSRCFGEMTKGQAADAVGFCCRYALGRDTRNDWKRITDNQVMLYGPQQQLDLVQKLLLS